MQRILHITGGMDRAGAETMIMNLYRKMDREEVQFDFMYFKDKDCDYDEEILSLGGRIHRILTPNPILRMLKLSSFLRKHPEYSIVHSHTLLNNAFNLIAAKKAGVPHRIAHSHNTSNGSKGVSKKIYEKLAVKIINSVGTSFFSCGHEASQFLFPGNSKVIVLPNAVDVGRLIDLKNDSQHYINENFNVKSTLKILQVGRLETAKNHQFTLKLAQAMKEKGINVTFFLAGQGPLYNEIAENIKLKGLEETVFLLGVRSDVLQLMAGADVMIMPSLFEGFPVVLVEAQSIGLPCVIANTIASEVDLELGLVEFLSLNDDKEKWNDALVASVNKKVTSGKISECLTTKGFDATTNAKWLAQFYNSL